MRSAQATPKAVQRTTFSRPLGKNRMAMPPNRGKNVISDNNGNMPLPPHRIIKNNQDNAKQDRQGVIAHIASLQAAQQSTRSPHYPCHSPASSIEQITLQQVRCRAHYPLKRSDKQQDE